jgi:hypothetical protein
MTQSTTSENGLRHTWEMKQVAGATLGGRGVEEVVEVLLEQIKHQIHIQQQVQEQQEEMEQHLQ